MKNTGKEYEALTEQVFARLLAQDNLCAKVERDVRIQGKATRHQVDVCFEFVAGVTNYRTIVQCKDWGSPVKQEQVLAFHGVLTDIPGQPRGIMVARSGFQEGAREFAEHHGIKLYELREPRDEDWEGLIRSLEIDIYLRCPRFEQVRLVADEEALRRLAESRGVSEFRINVHGHPTEMPAFYEATGESCDLNLFLNKLVPAEGTGPFPVRHEFSDRVVVEIPGSPIPRVPMKAIEALIYVSDRFQRMRIDLDHLVAYSFKDVLGGSVTFLRSDAGRAHERDEKA